MQTSLQRYNRILLLILNSIEQNKPINYNEVYKIPSSECHKLIIDMLQSIANTRASELFKIILSNPEGDNATNWYTV